MDRLIAEIDKRFDFHQPDEERRARHEDLRRLTKTYARDALEIIHGDSREASLFLTSLEEALFWANAHVARNVTPTTEAAG